ncbi:hypothetical protein BDV3_006232 [Batrachochytrium dendrobatidis]|nr:hypothetical protein O5D80_003070 [Batrachochytrium dendrobatidis]
MSSYAVPLQPLMLTMPTRTEHGLTSHSYKSDRASLSPQSLAHRTGCDRQSYPDVDVDAASVLASLTKPQSIPTDSTRPFQRTQDLQSLQSTLSCSAHLPTVPSNGPSMSSTSPKLHHISQHLSVTHSVAPVPDMHSISDTQTVGADSSTTLTHDSAVVLPRLYRTSIGSLHQRTASDPYFYSKSTTPSFKNGRYHKHINHHPCDQDHLDDYTRTTHANCHIEAVDKPYIKQTEATGTADKSLLMRDGSTVSSVRPPSSMLDDLLKRKHCEATDTDTTSGLSRGRPLEQRTRMRSMSVQLGNFRLGDMESDNCQKSRYNALPLKSMDLPIQSSLSANNQSDLRLRRASCDRYPSRKSEPDVSCPDQQLESQDCSLDQLPKIMSHTPKSSKYLLAPIVGTDNDSSIRQYSQLGEGKLPSLAQMLGSTPRYESEQQTVNSNIHAPMLSVKKTHGDAMEGLNMREPSPRTVHLSHPSQQQQQEQSQSPFQYHGSVTSHATSLPIPWTANHPGIAIESTQTLNALHYQTDKREPLVSYTNKSTLACEPSESSRTLAIASSDINPGSENTRSAETSMASHFPMNTKHHGSGEHSDCSNHPAINQQKYLQQTHARPNILPLGFQKCDSPLPNTTTQTEDANRKFPCNVCGKSFTRKYNLDAHLRSHNNIKPYLCPECSDAFVRKHDLQRHVVSVHKRSSFGPCPYCHRTYSRSDSFRKHMRMEERSRMTQ